jgi:hypothetical protein
MPTGVRTGNMEVIRHGEREGRGWGIDEAWQAGQCARLPQRRPEQHERLAGSRARRPPCGSPQRSLKRRVSTPPKPTLAMSMP